MDFNEVTTVFNPHLSSTMVMYAVRPTTIWTLRSDSSICVFKRSNPKVFSKFPFDGHDPNTAKMSVDDLGEKCVIFWDRLPILFFSLATGTVCELSKINSAFHPTSACWITLTGNVPAVLVGSLVGEVLLVSSDEEHNCNVLYTFNEPLTIREIYAHVEGDYKMVFLLVNEQVYTFISQEPIDKVFSSGSFNKVLILGEANANTQIDHRLTLDTLDGCLRLSALHFLGIISFKVSQKSNGTFTFEQTIMEVDTSNATSFEFCPLGLLIVLEKNILLLSDSKPKASLPMSGVQYIASDEKGLVLFKDDEIVTVPIKGLRTYIAKKAVRQKDFKYALAVAQDDPIKFFVLQKQIEKMPQEKIGPYVISLKWTINEVASSLGLESKAMLFYLRELLKNVICKERKKQRVAVIDWVFQLHSSFYPELEPEFIDFIKTYGKEMDPKAVYNRLDEIGFDKGLNVFAELTNDNTKTVDNMLLASKKDEALKYIEKLRNNSEVVAETLIRLLITNHEEVKNFMINNKLKLTLDYSLPILAHMPSIAHQVVSNYPRDDLTLILLVLSLCINHLDERIIQLMNVNINKIDLILRFANSYNCFAAAARILVRMGQPRLAVRVAMKVSLGYTNTLLITITDTQMQKEAWMELLHIVAPEEREKALTRVISSHLFTFEELIDIIDDDAFLFQYSDEMLNAVTELEKDAETIYYAVNFRPVTANDFPVQYDEGCCICQLPLLGTKFSAFPCGHKMHTECLEKFVQKIREAHPDNEIGALDSCPLCGIHSVETALQPFDYL